MRALLLGYGEIGSSIYAIFHERHDILIHDVDKGYDCADNLDNIDVLLVAIPYSENFVSIVREFQEKTQAKGTLVFSTVAIGTCSALNACHFPVEGKHPNIANDMRNNRHHWLGGDNKEVVEFLSITGIPFHQLAKPEYTEFLKLRSTAYYGVCIEFARYCKQVADAIGLGEIYIQQYDEAYNLVVHHRGDARYIRPVLMAPNGMIGGHCVVPNAKILDSQFPSPFLKMIYEKKA